MALPTGHSTRCAMMEGAGRRWLVVDRWEEGKMVGGPNSWMVRARDGDKQLVRNEQLKEKRLKLKHNCGGTKE